MQTTVLAAVNNCQVAVDRPLHFTRPPPFKPVWGSLHWEPCLSLTVGNTTELHNDSSGPPLWSLPSVKVAHVLLISCCNVCKWKIRKKPNIKTKHTHLLENTMYWTIKNNRWFPFTVIALLDKQSARWSSGSCPSTVSSYASAVNEKTFNIRI